MSILIEEQHNVLYNEIVTSILIEEQDNVFRTLQEKNGNVTFLPTEKQHNVFKEL